MWSMCRPCGNKGQKYGQCVVHVVTKVKKRSQCVVHVVLTVNNCQCVGQSLTPSQVFRPFASSVLIRRVGIKRYRYWGIAMTNLAL